jgi:Flp pilus assembly protein TadD
VLVRKQALRDSSWEQAEEHLHAAAESWPDLVLFQFDLGQLYRKRGSEDEARAVLLRVTEMVPTHPPDVSFQDDARRYLEVLGS